MTKCADIAGDVQELYHRLQTDFYKTTMLCQGKGEGDFGSKVVSACLPAVTRDNKGMTQRCIHDIWRCVSLCRCNVT